MSMPFALLESTSTRIQMVKIQITYMCWHRSHRNLRFKPFMHRHSFWGLDSAHLTISLPMLVSIFLTCACMYMWTEYGQTCSNDLMWISKRLTNWVLSKSCRILKFWLLRLCGSASWSISKFAPFKKKSVLYTFAALMYSFLFFTLFPFRRHIFPVCCQLP